jgi:hypothetical protein
MHTLERMIPVLEVIEPSWVILEPLEGGEPLLMCCPVARVNSRRARHHWYRWYPSRCCWSHFDGDGSGLSLGLKLPHKIGGGLDEVARGDCLEILLGKLISFVSLVVKVLGQPLLHCGELECELGESSEFDLILRKGLGHIVEHPVDFQGARIVLLCFLHECCKRSLQTRCSGEILVGDGSVGVVP